jgi:hypothetical protein
MCIERNQDILFGVGQKSCTWRYVDNCSGMQLVLPNPTTLAIPATAGLVHCFLTLVISGLGETCGRAFAHRFRPDCRNSNHPLRSIEVER